MQSDILEFARPKPGSQVLIVDDDVDSAEMFALSLQLAGFNTSVAHDAFNALAIASRTPPDLGMLDIGLPAVDGCELAPNCERFPGCTISD